MSLFAILNPDNSLKEVRDSLVAPVVGKGAKVRNYIVAALPVIDANTQKIVDGPVVIDLVNATKTWTVAALSTEELAEVSDRMLVIQIIATAGDMLNGVGTQTDRMLRVEKALGRTLNRLAKNGLLP